MKGKRIHRVWVKGVILSIFIFQFSFLMTGCRPKGILHSWEMRDVLADLHKTDALIQVSGLQYGYDEAQNIYYAQVLEKHGITQAQFDSSLVWYTAHPQLFDKIYPKVLKKLNAELDAYTASHEDELHLKPGSSDCFTLVGGDIINPKAPAKRIAFTQEQLDSVLWVIQHGYPSSWMQQESLPPTPPYQWD